MRRMAGTPLEIAARLRRRVLEEVGLPLTVGIARTKFLAKVASGVAKPYGLLEVPAERELAFLHALPVEALWGVGPATAGRLHRLGITLVGDVVRMEEGTLVSILGRASGHHLHALAHNRDPRRVRTRPRRRSIGSQRAMGRGPWTPEFVDSTLLGLVDRVMRRLRTARRVGRTVVLRLRFDDFSRATRSHTLVEATNETCTVLAAARGLLAAAMPTIEREGITLVGVTVANLDDDDQLALPLDRDRAALDAVLDEVRERYGVDAITRAVLLGRTQSQGVPLLPD
jgi:DNA polymerase-4